MPVDGLTIEFSAEDFDPEPDNTDMKRELQEFALELAVRDLTAKTTKCYLDRLRYFAEFLQRNGGGNFLDVDRECVRNYILDLKSRGLSAVSINGYLKVLNLYYSYLVSEELLDADCHPMKRIKFLKQPKIEKTVLNPDDMRKILAVPDRKSFFGLRTYCILLVFYDTAIRLNELVRIRIQDIDIDQGTVHIFGKGRKERVVSFGALTAKWVNRWLNRYRCDYPGSALFCNKSGNPLLENVVQRTLKLIGERAGVKLSPHLIRHSAATHRAQAGMPAFLLQRYLGHSSIKTTERYVHIAQRRDDLEAIKRFSPLDGLFK